MDEPTLLEYFTALVGEKIRGVEILVPLEAPTTVVGFTLTFESGQALMVLHEENDDEGCSFCLNFKRKPGGAPSPTIH